ncbi:hypothetical protein SE17_29585, partial [Kouleothrix aurantiaca]
MRTVPESQLRQFSAAALIAIGSAPDIAGVVADSLVDANLMGHDSHGVLRLPWYVAHARSGQVLPAARPSLVASSGATAQVDGRLGWG